MVIHGEHTNIPALPIKEQNRILLGLQCKFNATFNNISVISWWSALLVEETGEPGNNMLVIA
jgi:hypothetical protein